MGVDTPAFDDAHRQRAISPGLALAALALGGFAIGTTEFAAMGLLPQIAAGMDVSEPRAGWLISAYALGVVIGAPVLAGLGARLPRKTMLIALMIAFAIGNFLSVVAPTFPLLFASRFLAGLPHGAYFGIAALVAAGMVDPLKRARAVSMVMLGLSIANVVGVPLATWMGQHLGWRSAFLVVAAIGAATATAVMVLVPFAPAQPGASLRRELGSLRSAQVWLTLAAAMVGFGGVFAVYAYIAPTVTALSGLTEAAVPLILLTFGLGMVTGNILGGRLADRTVLGTLIGGITAMAAMLFLFSVLVHGTVTVFIGVYLVSTTCSLLFPAVQMRLMHFAREGKSLASSLIHSAFNIANALGAWIGGAVIAAGWGYTAPAIVGGLLAVLGIGVVLASVVLERRQGGVQAGGFEPEVVAEIVPTH